ncbi:hypothetical protein [Streptomyces sp. NPDC017230]|uniref:SGM_3592 family protein n=1 Tax=unclassified Streptomyces TaxID=2593676 RepID=UPI0037A433A9
MAGQTPQRDGREQPDDGAGDATRAGLEDETVPETAPEAAAEAAAEAADDTWDGLVLDEEFIRGAGTPEPSARARMLAARWRGEKPEPQPWRSDEPPAGWFFSKGRRRGWRRR